MADYNDIEFMRAAIRAEYPGPGWAAKVNAMAPNQLVALYKKLQHDGYLNRKRYEERRAAKCLQEATDLMKQASEHMEAAEKAPTGQPPAWFNTFVRNAELEGRVKVLEQKNAELSSRIEDLTKQLDFERRRKVAMKKLQDYTSTKDRQMSLFGDDACAGCPNDPRNGGTGNCNCILGMEGYTTC